MTGDWIPWIEGPVSTVLGFGLSSLSRSYREHRAQLLAEQRAVQAAKDRDEDQFQREVLDGIRELKEGYQSNRDRIAHLEGRAEATAQLRDILHGET